ncbi:hypothetical protein AMJ40_05405 [candidate division TA06 bacterium DG_26]|uniref:Polysaccharide chain length determinant N-terminal domain-containing protein n=1 Tax=candidate division TA06 bacterium DG_26 TaxID=1703771 RepID=A0A0S7WHR0_UNCT6|nr:MAG: hypothetical protein AMJ40_05405 [candidate division TA06 bacterium DG_26]
MDQEIGKRVDLRTYWRVVWRRKKLVLLPVIVVVATATGGSFLLTPVYRSSATILVEERMPVARSLERLLLGETRSGTDLPQAATIEAKIKSPSYLRKVVDYLDVKPDSLTLASILNHTAGDSSEAERAFQKSMMTSVARSTSVHYKTPSLFEISVEGNNPDRVYEIAGAVTEVFIQDALETQLEEVRSMYQFSVSQLAHYEEKLKESEDELRRFRQSMVRGTIEETPVTSSNINEANALLTDFSRERESVIERTNSYYPGISHLVDDFVPTEHYETLKSRLISLSAELAPLLVRYEWTAPVVLTANSRVNSLKEEIREEAWRIVDQRLAGADERTKGLLVDYEVSTLDLESLATIMGELRALIGRYEQGAIAAPTHELELGRLEREVESNRQIYNMLLEQSKAANLSEALEYVKVQSRYRVVEPATRPLYPVKPEKAKIGGMAVLIGIMMGVGLAFLSEYMDHSLKTVEDVQEYIELPVLGTIPKIVPGDKKWKK